MFKKSFPGNGAEDAGTLSPGECFDILQQAPVGAFVSTPDGRFLSVSPALASMYGYGGPGALVEAVTDIESQLFANPADRNRFKRILEEEGALTNFESLQRRRDGSLFWCVASAVAVRDSHGRISRYQGIASTIDIPGADVAALRLKGQVFDTSIALNGIANADCMVTEVNQSFLKAWGGADKAAVIGRPVLRFFRDPAIAAELFESIKVSGKWEGECEVRRKDGSTLTVLGHATGLKDDSGGFVGYQLSAIDITERKSAEEKLLESEEKYHSLVEQSADMMYLHDLDGKFLDVNQAAMSHTGYSREELLRMTVFDLHADQTLRDDIRQWWEKLSIGESVTLETTHFSKDGKGYRVEVKTGKICFGDREYILTLVRDITRRKQYEEALQQLNEALEHHVVERTRLAETRAKQLQSLAVELIEAEERERKRIADFLHEDLQQILAAAKMQLQIMSHKFPSIQELVKVDQMLKESIEKSRRLSHELDPAVARHANLYAALKWLVDQAGERYGLSVDLEADPARQLENRPMKVFLFRAVQELLFNVRKHAGVTCARVVLSFSEEMLEIKVSDEGRGFNPEILDSSNGRSGLGLLSLRERLQFMGGSLGIESVPGNGSVFTLRVPVALARAEKWLAQPEQIQPASFVDDARFGSRPGRNEPPGSGIRVLFVDDHKVMRQGLINLIVNQPGIEVIGEAANGREAVEQARHLQPDLIVMDVSMPGMDGIEATRRIKSEQPEIQVVGLSMYEEDHIVQAMREAGAAAFVSKSASSAELLKVIYDCGGCSG